MLKFFLIVDHYSRFITMYGMQGKSSSDVITSLTHFIADYNTQLAPNTIQRIHSDAGTEFKSSLFKNWTAKQKIRTTYAALEHQHQNSICERHYGIVKDIARKILVHARLNTSYIYYALQYACLIHNCLPVKSTYVQLGKITTPWQLFFGKPLRISHLRVFGCPAVCKRHQTTSDPTGSSSGAWDLQQGVPCIFVGIPKHSSCWLFHTPDHHTKVTTCEATFDEDFLTPCALNQPPFDGAIQF